MIKYTVRQNTNEKMPEANGKFYAYPVIEETMDMMALTAHMEKHNSGYPQAVSMGVLIALRKCVKEQVLAGKNVKLDGLCIFSLGIKNKEGAASEKEFSVNKNISGVKLRCRSTGDFSTESLNLEATLKRVSSANVSSTDDNEPDDTPTDDKDQGGSNPSGGGSGSGSQTSGGSQTGGSDTDQGGGSSDGPSQLD